MENFALKFLNSFNEQELKQMEQICEITDPLLFDMLTDNIDEDCIDSDIAGFPVFKLLKDFVSSGLVGASIKNRLS